MADLIETDLCVIGAGSGGLAVAAGAVQMGARVVLIEKGEMGGDCLNYGSEPSKSLIAAGKAAQTVRTAARFGVNGREPEIDFLTLVTGGTTVDPKETEPGQIRGTAIEGGESHELAAGDVVVIPNGVPHWFKEVRAPLLYFVVKPIAPRGDVS
jgi:pyruvate/2-oxoglutarate dehydrogenase complex dihydrolipoamide dehydrogenase (E3) component